MKGIEMKLRKRVLAVFVFSLFMAGAAVADLTCVPGIGWYDECGGWHCDYTSLVGNCLYCVDSIDVKG
jgi:hypothetical protein